MAKQTFSDVATKVLSDGDPLGVWLASDAGADIYPGVHAEQTAATTCGVAGASSILGVGIASDRGRLAIDSVVAETGQVYIYLWGSSAIVNAYSELRAQQAHIGARLIAGATTAGTLDYLPTTLAAVDDHTQYGRSAEWHLLDATDNKVFKVNLSV
jgi:hypothetical protein